MAMLGCRRRKPGIGPKGYAALLPDGKSGYIVTGPTSEEPSDCSIASIDCRCGYRRYDGCRRDDPAGAAQRQAQPQAAPVERSPSGTRRHGSRAGDHHPEAPLLSRSRNRSFGRRPKLPRLRRGPWGRSWPALLVPWTGRSGDRTQAAAKRVRRHWAQSEHAVLIWLSRAMDFVLPGAQTESGWGEWLDELGQRRAPHVAQ